MYRQDIDSIKGIAIIAVVLFHLGLLKSGYLGVDAFFVINGFFVIPSMIKHISANTFSYFGFVQKRLMRLYPLILIATTFCLFIGYVGMLPDNYENLGQAVVASNLMSENILSAITTHDYWNVANDYNPLMHLWYVGILVEFYLVSPLFFLIAKKISNSGNIEKTQTLTLWALTLLSLALYLIPIVGANKFYFLQYRFFELGAGGLIGLYMSGTAVGGGKTKLSYLVIIGLAFMLFSSLISQDYQSLGCLPIVVTNDVPLMSDGMLMPRMVLLLGTVVLTMLCIIKTIPAGILNNKVLAYIGKMSFSIFIWHQIFLAFYRYFVTNEISVLFFLLYAIIVGFVSFITYKYVEQRIKVTTKTTIVTVIASVLITIGGGLVYLKAGVVRDVPELNITTDNAHRGMHGEYCDRIYEYNKDFPSDKEGKMNVLVSGISYGRDMANVILESIYADSINLSYVYKWDESYINRIQEADYIFTFNNKDKVPYYVWANVHPTTKVYGIGSKHFGLCNGIAYTHRFEADYFNHSEPLHPIYKSINEDWKTQWGDEYVDFIAMSTLPNGEIRVFTDDHKFISQDCYHLTQAGARWFAKQIVWKKYFK